MKATSWSDVLGNGKASDAYGQYLAERENGEALAEWIERTSEAMWGDEHDPDVDFAAMADELEDGWLADLSAQIYSIVSGADNTDEIDATQSDIRDWLADGDLTGSETAEELAAQYIEYCGIAEEAIEE